jgi:hypothetical protein
MVDQRLATGDLVLPFVNFVGFEGQQINSTTSITQFTVATKSLNGVMATFRRGDYDQTRPALNITAGVPASYKYNTMVKTQSPLNQSLAPMSDYYQCFCGRDVYGNNPTTGATSNAFDIAGAILQRYGSEIVFDNYTGNANRWLDQAEPSTSGPSYQFTIDSKLYPQFVANVVDSAMIVKNFFDNGGLNLSTAGTIPSLKDFLGYAWMFAIGLDHHSDDQRKNKIVSGLDTRNSQIPITFSANNLPSAETLRPTIFAAMTSVLVIGPDRIISTVL